MQGQLQLSSAHLGDHATSAEGSLLCLFQDCPEVTLVFCNEGDLHVVRRMLNRWDKLYC